MIIPESWILVDLADVIVDMQPGFARRPNDREEGTKQLRTNNVSPEGEIDLSTVAHVKASAADLEKYQVRQGDVIFNNTNSVEWVGKTAYFYEEGEYVLSNHMTRLRVDERVLDGQFLAKYLHHLWRIGRSFRWAKHWVNQAAIDQSALSRFRIVLPTLPEQRRIVSVMREADGLRRVRHDSARKAQELLPAFFEKMFGNPLLNPKKWATKSIGKLLRASPHYGSFAPPTDEGKYLDLRVGNIIDGRLAFEDCKYLNLDDDQYDRFRLWDGDVLLVRAIGSASHLGKCAVFRSERTDVVFDSHLMRLQFDPNLIIPEYFHACFTSTGGRQLLAQYARSSAVQFNVNTKEIRAIVIPVPPYDLQLDFLRVVEAIKNNEANQETVSSSVTELQKSIYASAFTGELTTHWRSQRQPELIEAAHQRDALLSRSVIELAAGLVSTSTLTAELTVTRSVAPEREHILAALSRNQQRVFELVNSIEGYFTLSQLSQARYESIELSHADVRQGLQVLAALGLVKRVRLATEPTKNEIIFTPAYRRLLPSHDDARLRDLDQLRANGG